MSGSWQEDVLDFWFGLETSQWFGSDDALDHRVREQFERLWAEKRQLPPESFLVDARTAIAGVILFDQFPRNMFRGHADQFATDSLALAIARGAVDRQLDEALGPDERMFLYTPFMHSEDLADQDRSLLLFTALGDAEQIDYARRHRDIIARFGRFPH